MKPEKFVVSTKLPAAPALPATDKLARERLRKTPGVGVQNAVDRSAIQHVRLARAQMYPQVTLNSTYLYGD